MRRRRLRATNAARSDLADIWFFIAQASVDAADRAIDRIADGQAQLVEYPEAGSKRESFGRGVRTLVVDRYLIFYRLEPKTIVILRVFDGRRNIRPEDVAAL
jgi:toxin ParE1/3/4